MSEENMGLEIAKETIKEVAKDFYADAGKPIVQPTSEVVGLVPRAIKAALSPLEKWILQKEYNVAETKKMLEEKLRNTPPELIEAPEPHIAVPALQYISYCMDNNELRDMYANLLANSMNRVVKNGVHPGYVEIIKQLSPDEAKILKYMNLHNTIPTITMRYVNKGGSGIDIIKNFSDVGEKVNCESPQDIAKYFDNLVRLGLINNAGGLYSLTDKTAYEPLKNHRWVVPHSSEESVKSMGFDKISFKESYVSISSYGKSFCSICLDSPQTITIEAKKG